MRSLIPGDGRVPLPICHEIFRSGAAELRLLSADRVYAGRRHQSSHGHTQDAARRGGTLFPCPRHSCLLHTHCIFTRSECALFALCMHCVHTEYICGCCCTVQARFYFACVMSAVAEMHAKDWMHRDLKMENIMIGKNGYAKVC